MSLAYYIVLDHQEPGFETFVNGKAIAHAIDELDALCAEEGLTKLDDFMGQSVSELNELLDEEIERPEGEEGHRWFEPDTGIALIDFTDKRSYGLEPVHRHSARGCSTIAVFHPGCFHR